MVLKPILQPAISDLHLILSMTDYNVADNLENTFSRGFQQENITCRFKVAGMYSLDQNTSYFTMKKFCNWTGFDLALEQNLNSN